MNRSRLKSGLVLVFGMMLFLNAGCTEDELTNKLNSKRKLQQKETLKRKDMVNAKIREHELVRSAQAGRFSAKRLESAELENELMRRQNVLEEEEKKLANIKRKVLGVLEHVADQVHQLDEDERTIRDQILNLEDEISNVSKMNRLSQERHHDANEKILAAEEAIKISVRSVARIESVYGGMPNKRAVTDQMSGVFEDVFIE